MGKDTPDASSRWSCDSVVRAPMAPQEITNDRKLVGRFKCERNRIDDNGKERGCNQTRRAKITSVSDGLLRRGESEI